MKILHLMLSNFYIDGFNYQENILPRQNKEDGHEVKIVASTETYINPNKLGYVKPAKYINEDMIEVIRIPYRKVLPHYIMTKIRSYYGVFEILLDFKPDVILHHGVPSFEVLTLLKYKRKHPNVKIYLDSHEDIHNSARNIISKEILHRRFYGPIVRKALPCVEKVLCVNIEAMDFVKEMYKVPEEKIEFYPLGGIIFEERERLMRRKRIRNELKITDDDILMVHTGKMNRAKKTEDLLKAFSKIDSDKFKLILIGAFSEDVRLSVESIIRNDKRIKYLGWKKGEELFDYLCAADLYLQPGSQSGTMQNALCCGCALMLYPYKSHSPYLKGNGFYVKTVEEMIDVFKTVNVNPEILKRMSKTSIEIGLDLLDYRKLAARLYI